MDPFFAASILLLFVLGTMIGSFLNVVIYRLPRGESVVGDTPSHCPRCGRRLGAADLVPLFSWLALRGRCRSCGTRISSRYFGVELLTGLLFVGVFLALGFTPAPGEPLLQYHLLQLTHGLILVCLFVPMIFIDQDLQIVPDELSAPLFVIGLVWNIVEGLTGHPWLVTLNTQG
ncbi:MAG: prepilin peptidase, partial [Armatimonadota bacterium]|nr:prepilin peptidase [Armatimonadota bacterium]